MKTSTTASELTFSKEPSLHAQYAFEREGISTIEIEAGYCTYQFRTDEDAIWLIDIYVVPEARRLGICYKLADEVARIGRENQCKYMLGSVDWTTNGATESLKVILKYGYQLVGPANGLIWFKKKLED